MKPVQTINGAWSDEANGWVSETLELTGDAYLEVSLPNKGRLVIKKSETPDGPWPKALITKWAGPQFRIRIRGVVQRQFIRVILTETPNKIQYANI